MLNYLLVVLLLFCNLIESKLSYQLNQTLDEENTIVCRIGDIDFWKHFHWHFGNATSVTVSLLLCKYSDLVEKYLENLLDFLFGYPCYQRSYQIRRFQCRNKENQVMNKTVQFVQDFNQTLSVSDMFRYKSYQEFLQVEIVRRYSGDPEDAYFFVAWDTADLHMFLQDCSKSVLENPRGSYLIALISPEVNETVDRSLIELLKWFWKSCGVLNAQIKLPCSSHFQLVYRFDPFVSVNGDRGILEKFLINDALAEPKKFINSLKNLHGYPVNISLFTRRPSAFKDLPRSLVGNKVYDKSEGYGGIDAVVLANIAMIMNFSTVVVVPEENEEYGYLNKFGIFVGSLGDVVYRRVVASFNARFISYYGTDDIEFTTPTTNDLLCLLVPKSEKIPQWLKIFRCFTTTAWFSIFALYILISICWYCLRQINMALLLTNRYRNEYVDNLFEVLALFVTVPFINISTDNQRMFVAICVMFNVVFGGIFQGSLYTSYTKTTYYPDINSLESFDKTGKKIGTSSQSFTDIFGDKPNPLMASLKKKVLILNGTSSLYYAATKRKTAAFERKNDAVLRIETEYTRHSDGFPMLHMVPDCPWSYYLSYIVPKGSPYIHVFDMLIMSFREAGFVNKWTTDTVDALILEKKVRSSEENAALKSFSVEDMQAAFLLVSIGLAVSIIVFVLEVCIYNSKTLCNENTCSFN